eukprot:115642_1
MAVIHMFPATITLLVTIIAVNANDLLQTNNLFCNSSSWSVGEGAITFDTINTPCTATTTFGSGYFVGQHSESWSNYSVSIDFNMQESDSFFLCLRSHNKQSSWQYGGYEIRIHYPNQEIYLYWAFQTTNDIVITTLYQFETNEYQLNINYHFEVIVIGYTLTGYWDNKEIFKWKDNVDQPAFGTVGFRIYQNGIFSNLIVKHITTESNPSSWTFSGTASWTHDGHTNDNNCPNEGYCAAFAELSAGTTSEATMMKIFNNIDLYTNISIQYAASSSDDTCFAYYKYNTYPGWVELDSWHATVGIVNKHSLPLPNDATSLSIKFRAYGYGGSGQARCFIDDVYLLAALKGEISTNNTNNPTTSIPTAILNGMQCKNLAENIEIKYGITLNDLLFNLL